MFAKFRGPRVLPVAVSVIASLVLVLATVGTVVGDSEVQVTFYKEICPNYSNVPANASPGNLDVTRGHSADLDTTYGTGDTQHVVNDALHTNSYPNGDISAACAGVSGWKFSITDSGGKATYTTYTTGNGGVVAVPLTDDQIALAHSGTGLWVREETLDTAGFGSIRCYNDARNGDNLEQITNLPNDVTQVYCVAYNVRQAITFAKLPDVTYGAAPITLGATASSGLPVSYDATGACSLSGTTLTITGVGTCSVTASQPGKADPFWSPAVPVPWTFNIHPAPLTIAAKNQAKTYGTTANLGTTAYTVTNGNLVSGDSISGVTLTSLLGAPAGAAVGDYTIVPSAATGTGLSNYTIGYSNGTLSVSAKPLTITAADQSKVYGSALSLGTSAFAATGLLSTDSITAVTLTSAGADTGAVVGGYPIVPTAATGTGLGNYTIAYANGTLAVSVKPLTITATNQSKVFGSSLDLGTTAFTTSGLSNGDKITAATLTSAGSDAGAAVGGYPIVPTAAIGTGLSNYSITYAIGTLTVSVKPLTITATDRSKVFGSTLDLGTSAFTVTGLLSGDSVTGVTLTSSGAAAGAVAGDYAIVPSAATGTGLDSYTITYANGMLSMTKASLTVAAPNATRVQGTDNPALTPTYSGFVNGDTASNLATQASCNTTAVTGSPIGIYPVTCSGALADNYTFNYVQGTLTVTAASATPTPGPSQSIGGATATPTAGSSQSQSLLGATGVPHATPPATNAASHGPGGSGTPLFALLICLALGRVAVLMAVKQRRTVRN